MTYMGNECTTKNNSITYSKLIRDISIQSHILNSSIKQYGFAFVIASGLHQFREHRPLTDLEELKISSETKDETTLRLQLEAQEMIVLIKPYFDNYCNLIKKIDSSKLDEKYQLSIKRCKTLKESIDSLCKLVLADVKWSGETSEQYMPLVKKLHFSMKKIKTYNEYLTDPYTIDFNQIKQKGTATSPRMQLIDTCIKRWKLAIESINYK